MSAPNINTSVITGNLTKAPELFESSEHTFCRLRVGVTGRGGKPNYFNVVVFGRQAENCDLYLTKGSAVAVEGWLDWYSRSGDGGYREYVSIVARFVEFLGSGSDGEPVYLEIDASEQLSLEELPDDTQDLIAALIEEEEEEAS